MNNGYNEQAPSSLAQAKQTVDAATFSAKYGGKPEVYRFLASDVGAYLPDYDVVTVWHVRDLAAGKRLMIMSKDIKHLNVPHFEHLTVKKFLEYARQYLEVMRALPTVRHEREKIHRQYIINVIYTIVGAPFSQWVNSIVEQRHAEIKEKGNMNIEMDPQVSAAFQASTAVSG